MSKIAKNKTTNAVELIFSMAIAEMLAWVNLVIEYFTADQADFLGYSPKYSAEFLTEWKAKLAACKNIATNVQNTSVLQGKTESLVALMKQGNMAVKKIKNFILEAFGDSIAIQNEFGLNIYDKVRNNQKELGKFLVDLYTIANKHSVKLITKGYTQVMIDALKPLGEAIQAAETDQEKFKGSKGVLTEDRKKALNELYLLTRSICEDGKLVYPDSKAKAAHYLLPVVECGSEVPPTPPVPPTPAP